MQSHCSSTQWPHKHCKTEHAENTKQEDHLTFGETVQGKQVCLRQRHLTASTTQEGNQSRGRFPVRPLSSQWICQTFQPFTLTFQPFTPSSVWAKQTRGRGISELWVLRGFWRCPEHTHIVIRLLHTHLSVTHKEFQLFPGGAKVSQLKCHPCLMKAN